MSQQRAYHMMLEMEKWFGEYLLTRNDSIFNGMEKQYNAIMMMDPDDADMLTNECWEVLGYIEKVIKEHKDKEDRRYGKQKSNILHSGRSSRKSKGHSLS